MTLKLYYTEDTLEAGVDESGAGCERVDAEILTDSGWKKSNELLYTDKIMSLTPEQNLVWQNINLIIIKDINENLIRLYTDNSEENVECVVTNDHYFDILRRNSQTLDYCMTRVGVSDLMETDYIPLTGNWEVSDKKYFTLPNYHKNVKLPIISDKIEIDMDLWMAFFGLYLAKGNLIEENGQYGILISLNDQNVYNLLKLLPFKLHKLQNDFFLESNHLYKFLKSIEKRIPYELKNTSKRQLLILLNWIQYSENKKDEILISSEKLKDDLFEIILKCGYIPSSTKVKELDFVVRIHSSEKKIACRYLHKEMIDYTGKVFCLNLKEYHNFYVRRNGSCYFTGNCLIGRVYAAAVIWPMNFDDEIFETLEYKLLKDSKKLSEKRRYQLKEFIETNAIDFAIGFCEPSEIDQINILNARIKAMHRAIDQLKIRPQTLLIDGNYFQKYTNGVDEIPHTLIVKGDNSYQSIAAASILAKCYHDDYIQKLHEEFPMYGLNNNHGYGTSVHYIALKKHGATSHHRITFDLHLNLIENSEDEDEELEIN